MFCGGVAHFMWECVSSIALEIFKILTDKEGKLWWSLLSGLDYWTDL